MTFAEGMKILSPKFPGYTLAAAFEFDDGYVVRFEDPDLKGVIDNTVYVVDKAFKRISTTTFAHVLTSGIRLKPIDISGGGGGR